MDSLRTEILQAQNTRSDLLKSKLGLVGVIGAVGLGLAGSKSSAHADLVLCAVPLLCVYVDLLCRHLSLRVLVIGTFMRRQMATPGAARETRDQQVLSAYEHHAHEARSHGAFDLEDWAVTWSTAALSIAVGAYGVLILATGTAESVAAGIAFVISGLVGVLTTTGSEVVFKRRREAVVNMAVEALPAALGTP
jgi:hypothetical protein